MICRHVALLHMEGSAGDGTSADQLDATRQAVLIESQELFQVGEHCSKLAGKKREKRKEARGYMERLCWGTGCCTQSMRWLR
jgi:hypothetical protein